MKPEKMVKLVVNTYPPPKTTDFEIEDPESVYMYVKKLANCDREVLRLICLDTRLKVINDEIVAVGGLTEANADLRILFRTALRNGASRIMLVHNHPSGDTEFSSGDIITTHRVKKAGELIGIELVDHVIVGNDSYRSAAQENII